MRKISLLVTLTMFGAIGCDRISVGDLGGDHDAGKGDASSHDPKTDAASPSDDATTPGTDVGAPPIDTGSPVPDVVKPPTDGSTPPLDTPTPPLDANTPPLDANAPSQDVRADGAPICPSDFKSYLPLTTPANCPASRPPGGSCDLPENSICVYQETSGFDACGCYAVVDGSMWKCWGASGSSTTCPLSPPTNGSSCAAQPNGDLCNYPFLQCSCDGSSSTWRCSEETFFAPREVVRACPPDGIDESKLVKNLTDSEVLSWCQWYGDPSRRPRPPINPNFPADDTTAYGYTWITDFFGGGLDGCFAELPVDYCVRNLRYQACDAPLRELDDCLETMRATGFNAIVGRGCGPYFRNSSCDKTIVQRGPTTAAGCKVPLK